jgi:formylmethanofuran dehydrogenase subunit E
MTDLDTLLATVAARHRHLCPRQVLGLRLGLAGAAVLGLALPRRDRRLIVISEADGCFADGLEVATGATIGRRTLHLVDYGKIAATCVDVATGQAVRLSPRPDVRERAWAFAPDARSRYAAQLRGYQMMPDAVLLRMEWVTLVEPPGRLLSRPGLRTVCERCGEEIINQREVWRDGRRLCRACAGPAYYAAEDAPTG